MNIKVDGIYIEGKQPRYESLISEKYLVNYNFVIRFKKGLKKYCYKFMTLEPYYKIAYVDCKAPEDKEENRKHLILAYGALKNKLAQYEMFDYFEKQDEEEEKKRKEEEAGKIKPGEQVSIEKYLKNCKKEIDNFIYNGI